MERKRLLTSAEEVATPSGGSLHTKYRPQSLARVLGQKAVVKSLESALSAKARPHTFLFTGPAGTGKTTLARIVAAQVGCLPSNITEANAASNTGVDDARALLAPLRYNGFGESPNKAIILDECHRLSKQAWDVLLKDTEEPPAHVFFFFCTTEPEKVPSTITSRALAYHLAPLKFDDIMDMLEDACDGERYEPAKGVLEMVARACGGSGRNALTMLAAVHAATLEDAEIILQAPLDNPEVIDLCRLMVKGDLTWGKCTATLKGLSDVPAETIRILIVNYLNACLMGARNEKDAVRLLEMLECFLKPCNPSDKLGPLLVAFGRYIYP